MICISDDIIQKYIDGEATPSEVSFVENHIDSCNKCVLRIENQRRLSNNIKRAINLLSIDSIEVPKFEINTKSIKRQSLIPKTIYYIIAAACVLLFVIVITKKKKSITDDHMLIQIGSVIDIDANRPVSELPLVINIIDSNGIISEYFIE